MKGIHPYLLPLIKSYDEHSDMERAIAMAAYMKNNFVFFGIPSPLRKDLTKSFFATYGMPAKEDRNAIVQSAYDQTQRELHYFAINLLVKEKKTLASSDLAFMKSLIEQNSWWDSIDTIGPHLVGFIVAQDARLSKTMDKWAVDKNFWIRRVAILHQMKWKRQTDFNRLCSYCLLNADSKEFFIQKAMGWALREYAYVDAKAVKQFITANQLPKLTIREGMKHIQ